MGGPIPALRPGKYPDCRCIRDPFDRVSASREQRLNLKIIERHGAGICLPLKAMKKELFRSAINRVLTDDTFKTNMKRLQSFQEQYNGAENAAKILQEAAATHGRVL